MTCHWWCISLLPPPHSTLSTYLETADLWPGVDISIICLNMNIMTAFRARNILFNSHLHSRCSYLIQLLTECIIASCRLSHPSIRSLSRLNCDIYTLSRNYLQTSNKCLMIFVVATLSVAAGQCCECCNKWFGKKVILSINGTLIWCNHRPTSAPTHGTRGLEETRYKYEKYGKPGANGSKAAIISASLTVPLPHVYEQRCDWEVFLSLVFTIILSI